MTTSGVGFRGEAAGLVERPRMPACLRTPAPLSTVERGPQGPPGERGPTGPQGLPGDYGSVRYGEAMGSGSISMDAAVDTAFVVRAPRTVLDNLKPPFSGFPFFDDQGVLRCRASGDSYQISVRLSITPLVVGGSFSMSILIAGNLTGLAGPTSTRTVDLTVPAGTVYRFDQLFQVFPSSGFAANGARLVMRSSVPVTLSDDVVYITPLVAGT